VRENSAILRASASCTFSVTFGLDTLRMAEFAAEVVGGDFSSEA
jgi:hypothetical protein